MPKEFPELQVVRLEQNYRSTPHQGLASGRGVPASLPLGEGRASVQQPAGSRLPASLRP